MGASYSRPPTGAGGLVLSFDALGTLYHFREPFAKQYLSVAKNCGLKTSMQASDIEKSFKLAFKSVSSQYPNYGRGTLESPQEWWNQLVTETFDGVVDGEKLPNNLGEKMYQHFSSSAAYQLYPDVKPFLENMNRIRKKYSKVDDPILMLGIITNSDPRVSAVMKSLDVKVGLAEPRAFNASMIFIRANKMPDNYRRSGLDMDKMLRPWIGYWNVDNDFDFLTTSYQAGAEKPDRKIFKNAFDTASFLCASRGDDTPRQSRPFSDGFSPTIAMARRVADQTVRLHEMTWIHVGDDYMKDYLGASGNGMEALHLVRDGEGKAEEGARTITSLDEVSAIVNLMMAQNHEES